MRDTWGINMSNSKLQRLLNNYWLEVSPNNYWVSFLIGDFLAHRQGVYYEIQWDMEFEHWRSLHRGEPE